MADEPCLSPSGRQEGGGHAGTCGHGLTSDGEEPDTLGVAGDADGRVAGGRAVTVGSGETVGEALAGGGLTVENGSSVGM
ncbi:hypothetical protein ACQP10_31885 [Streptosporangium sandarakinum]|uniref:hypothetical protein n=1 Tax=Streptosporangium TaxID=2000 RepID=UPI0033844178